MARLTLIAFLILSALNSFSQSLCEKLAKAKKEYYGFKPNSLKGEQVQAKSADLDKFWELAKADPEKSLPCLKEMILSENNDPYFCFDASTLILSIDKKEQYLDVVLQGVNKADLGQLQLEAYLRVCFFLSKKGKDITAATEKLISEKGAHVFLTAHAIDLSAIDASLFLYNTMSDEIAENSLINTIKNGNATAKHNAAVVLNILSTNKGDAFINELMNNGQLADSTKAFVLKDRETFSKADNASTVGKTEERLRTERHETIQGLSDEGLQRFFRITTELITLRSRSRKDYLKH